MRPDMNHVLPHDGNAHNCRPFMDSIRVPVTCFQDALSKEIARPLLVESGYAERLNMLKLPLPAVQTRRAARDLDPACILAAQVHWPKAFLRRCREAAT